MFDDALAIGSRLAKEECAASIFRSEFCNAAAAGVTKSCDAATAGVLGGRSWSYMVGEVLESGAADVVGPGDLSIMIDKTYGTSGGVEVRKHDCVILGISAGGLIDLWNRNCPGYSVSGGDRGALGIHA